jgi:hypothetical protein
MKSPENQNIEVHSRVNVEVCQYGDMRCSECRSCTMLYDSAALAQGQVDIMDLMVSLFARAPIHCDLLRL